MWQKAGFVFRFGNGLLPLDGNLDVGYLRADLLIRDLLLVYSRLDYFLAILELHVNHPERRLIELGSLLFDPLDYVVLLLDKLLKLLLSDFQLLLQLELESIRFCLAVLKIDFRFL